MSTIDIIKAFREALNRHVPNISDRPTVTALSIATYLSSELAISPVPVEDFTHYVNMEHTDEIHRVIGLLNEVSPVNVPLAKTLTTKLLSMRYFAANPKELEKVPDHDCFVCMFSGASLFLSNDEQSLLTQYKDQLFGLLPYVRITAEH